MKKILNFILKHFKKNLFNYVNNYYVLYKKRKLKKKFFHLKKFKNCINNE